MDSLRIARLWAATAWADGVMHPAEAEAIERFIEATGDLSKAEREQARALLTEAPDIDVDEVKELPRESREGVYRAARGIVWLDRQLTDDERAFLERLRDSLDLDEQTIARIEAESR